MKYKKNIFIILSFFVNQNCCMELPIIIEEAVKRNQIAAVTEFLNQNRSNIEAVNNEGQAPLIIACKAAKFEMVKLLVEKDAEIQATDNYGHNANYYVQNHVNYLNRSSRENDPDYREVITIYRKISAYINNKIDNRQKLNTDFPIKDQAPWELINIMTAYVNYDIAGEEASEPEAKTVCAKIRNWFGS